MTEPARRSYEEMRTIADEFLKSHRLGIFATGKRDGTPQQSILGYSFDGTDIVIQTGSATAKVHNIRRLPGVALSVSEGPTNVTVYGTARLLQGDEAEQYLGEPPGSGRQRGVPTLIVFQPDTYRWARLDG